MKSRFLARTLWSVSAIALILAVTFRSLTRPATLIDAAPSQPWVMGGFQPSGTFPTIEPNQFNHVIRTIGSYIENDQWSGEAKTSWFNPSGELQVLVAGYPQTPGCDLWVEVQNDDGMTQRIRCDLANPKETWKPWRPHLPQGALKIRLVAIDAATGNFGWLAFSEPFAERAPWLAPALMAAQTFSTWALAVVLVWAPGFVVLHWIRSKQFGQRKTSALHCVALIGVGPLLLLTIGLGTWIVGGWLNPIWTGGAGVAVLWAGLGLFIWQKSVVSAVTDAEVRVLAIAGLISLVAVCKGAFSGGPEGELYGGTLSRTLAVGDRPDSRIPFHVVQTIAHHFGPASREAERYFAPFTFFSRGPAAGLMSAPIVFATAGRPPVSLPNQPWVMFDQTGFAAYRIVLAVLATTVLVALFFAMTAFVSSEAALTTAGWLALSPFGIHETMFTWPKMSATACLIAAFLGAHHRRPVAAAVALAAGYYFHPMALLWTPWIGLWLTLRFFSELGIQTRASAAVGALKIGTAFLGMLLALVVPWMIAGALAPHYIAQHIGQGGFFSYVRAADNVVGGWPEWLRSRWMNFANTFIPLWLYFVHRDHPVLNSVYAPSGDLVKFSFSWWNTLPLGAGLLLWADGFRRMIEAGRRMSLPTLVLFIGPAFLLIVYWGASATGLMREAGHPLLIAFCGLVGWAVFGKSDTRQELIAWRGFPMLQLPEAIAMLWMTTLVHVPLWRENAQRWDVVWFIVSLIALSLVARVLITNRKGTVTPT